MDPLQTRLDALEHHVQTLHQQTRTITRRLRWWRGMACGLLGLAVLTWALPVGTAPEAQKKKKVLEERVTALEDLLRHFSREGNEITITGANLHLINGLDQTVCTDDPGEPIPDCPNGLGNLIVEYNELRTGEDVENIRTGSHNVVVGRQQNFSRFGGLVAGSNNTISGDFASVSGGGNNIASGDFSSITGGANHTASGALSSISGGEGHRTEGILSWISGGVRNTTTAGAEWSSVSGGENNTASWYTASVYGGAANTASAAGASVCGGLDNTASGDFAAVSGGAHNTASGLLTSVSGGRNRTAEGEFDWVAGSLIEDD